MVAAVAVAAAGSSRGVVVKSCRLAAVVCLGHARDNEKVLGWILMDVQEYPLYPGPRYLLSSSGSCGYACRVGY
jgi:hypothetical protein